MQENNDIKILNKLYQCAEMGTIGIESVIDKAHQEEFRNTLHSQKEEYDKIVDQIVSILKKYGCEEKHIGTMAKKSSEMISDAIGIARQTYAGYERGYHEPSIESLIALAEIYGVSLDYITGRYEITNIARIKSHVIDDMIEKQETDEEIMELMEHFLKTEQHNLDEMKKYL